VSVIKVDKTGVVRFVYCDELRSLLDEGQATILRVSSVEPNAYGQWIADLGPVNGPALGPFQFRREALNAEVAWLERRL